MITPDRTYIDLRGSNRGFTLIELLVVTTMIAILVGMAVISFNLVGDDRGVQRQALRLSSLIAVVADEAQMQGRDYGLEFLQSGYRFVEFDPYLESWQEVTTDDLLQSRQLDADMEFELFLEGRRVLLQAEAKVTEPEEDDNERDLTDDYLPHVLIWSNGEITPFDLQVIRLTDNSTVGLRLEAGKELEVITDVDEL